MYGWIAGRRPSPTEIRDNDRFATDLAGFLVALRSADTADAPAPGLHSAYRGGPLEHWDLEMRDLVHRVFGRERDLAVGLWRDALDASFTGAPVWVHGDTAIANLLVQRTPRLSAVVDFGCSAVGDPPATPSSGGRSSTARRATPTSASCESTPRPGREDAAGRCGRP